MAIKKANKEVLPRESRRESTKKYIKEHYQGVPEHIFERPKLREGYLSSQKIQIAIVALAIVVLVAAGIWLYVQSKKQSNANIANQAQEMAGGWFAVKLLDGEVIYGKIDNLKSDPIVINPVYYNYDQVKDGATKDQKINEAGDLRLVKRGQETHGPDGALEVFKTQLVYLERLKKESKVLQAILQNEK